MITWANATDSLLFLSFENRKFKLYNMSDRWHKGVNIWWTNNRLFCVCVCVGCTSPSALTKASVLNKPPNLYVCPTFPTWEHEQCSNALQSNMPIKWKEMMHQFVNEWLCGQMSIPLLTRLCHFTWAHALCSILLSLTKLQRLPSNSLLLDTAGPVTMAADSHSFSFPLHCKPLLSLLWHEKRTVRVCEMGIFCEIMGAFCVKILTFSMCIMKLHTPTQTTAILQCEYGTCIILIH